MPKKEETFDHRGRLFGLNEWNRGKDAYNVEKDDEVRETLVVQIPKSAWRRGAYNFEEWDKQNPNSAFYRQLFSMICHLTTSAIETYKEMLKADEKKSGDDGDVALSTERLKGPPVKMYIESMFATDEVTGEKAMPYVIAYRFHVFLFTPSITFGGLFWDMLEENTKLRTEELEKVGRFKTHGYKSIMPHQHYKYINTIEHFVKAICGLYQGHHALWNNMDELLCAPDGKTYKEWRVTTEFKAHVGNIFTLKKAKANYEKLLVDLDLTINKKQKNADGYVGNKLQMLNSTYERTIARADGTGGYAVPHFNFHEPVLRLDASQIHPASMARKYMPDYQILRLQKAQDELGQRLEKLGKFHQDGMELDADADGYVESKYASFVENATVFDPTLLHEYGVDLIQNNKELRELMTSDVALMRAHAYRSKFWELKQSDPTWASERKKYQLDQLDEFHCRVWDPNSYISEPMQRLVEFQQTNPEPMLTNEQHNVPKLSIFANAIIKWMERLEQLALVSTTHRSLFTLLIGAKDAFRVTFGLHFNMILTGKSATSKSFNLDILKEILVPGTMEQLTYQTPKADAVDGHRNDTIQGFHEIPRWFFTPKGKEVDASEAMMKEKLTSLKTRCKTLHISDDTGVRRQRITESECISCFFGCTNDDPSLVTESLASRFFWAGTEENEREGRSIPDLMPARNNFDDRDFGAWDDTLLRGRQDQMIHCVVEKLIYCGIINDVSMDVANIVHQQFDKYMAKKQTTRVHPRCSKRLRIMARLLTITHAIECVFRVPGGKHYGKVFKIEMVLDLEPFLWCTEEIALFTIGLLEDQYVDPCRFKTLSTLKEMDAILARAPEARYKLVKATEGTSEENKYDYNYVTFNKSIHKLKNAIFCAIPKKRGRPSEFNIKATLDRLSKETFMHRPYKFDSATNEAYEDKLAEKQSYTCVQIDRDKVCIHTALLFDTDQECNTMIEKAVAASQHHHTITEKFLSGQTQPYNWEDPNDVWTPHVFRTYTRKATSRINRVANPLYSTKTSRLLLGMKEVKGSTRSKLVFTYNGDLDTYGYRKHLKAIGCTDPNAGSAKYLKSKFKPLDAEYTFDYPETYMEELKGKKRKCNEQMGAATKKKKGTAVKYNANAIMVDVK